MAATVILTAISSVPVNAIEDIVETPVVESSVVSESIESIKEDVETPETTTESVEKVSDTYSEEIYVEEEKDETTKDGETTKEKPSNKIDTITNEIGETFISYTTENFSEDSINYVVPHYVYTGDYDLNNPLSWKQGNAPYSNRYFAFSGTNFGDASCGVHTMANIMLKSGFKEVGFSAEDAYEWALDNGIGSNYGGMPAYNWERFASSTNGYLQYEGMGYSQEWIRNEYNKGNFVVISVTIGGTGHLVALDYVDDDGTIYIVDSAIRAKYLNDMDGGGVHYAISFSNKDIKSYNAPKLWAGDNLSDLKKLKLNDFSVDAPKEEVNINNPAFKELEKQAEKLQEELSQAKKEVNFLENKLNETLEVLNTAKTAKDNRIEELSSQGIFGRVLEKGLSFESIFNQHEHDTIVSQLSKDIDTYTNASYELETSIKTNKEKVNEIVKKLTILNSKIFSLFNGV